MISALVILNLFILSPAHGQNQSLLDDLLQFRNSKGVAEFEIVPMDEPGDKPIRMKRLVANPSIEAQAAAVVGEGLWDQMKNESVPQFYLTLLGHIDLREVIQNAKQGSPHALLALSHFKKAAYLGSQVPLPELDQINHKKLQALCAKENRIHQAEKLVRKAQLDALDRDPVQLDDLIKTNDRKGVARLYEAYLPWEDFDSVESKFWKDWLKTLREPAKAPQKLTFLRGTSIGQTKFTKDLRPYFMPPFLIHNQGTYNRRLRSLGSSREKFFSLSFEAVEMKEFGVSKSEILSIFRAGGLSMRMKSHADAPFASPFISWTQAYEIANEFAKPESTRASDQGRIAAITVARSNLLPNFMSRFPREFEWLSGIIFPDEVQEYLGPAELYNWMKSNLASTPSLKYVVPDAIESPASDVPWEIQPESPPSYLYFLDESFRELHQRLLAPACSQFLL